MAFSSNGYNWTGYDPTSEGYATPVFGGTLDGTSFDTDHIGWFKVIKNDPTDWQAFYSGGKDTTYQALNGIGYATSTDGINWIRRQTLLTTSDGVAWRSQSVWMPSVVKTGNNYELFFLGSDNADIVSSDWIQWKLGRAGLTPDTTPPTVSSTLPANAATGVAVNSVMTATFSEALDPLTVTTATFTLKQGATPVSGAVTYAGVTATFTPSVNLASGTVYTATITTGVKDLAGNALAANYSWSFTSSPNYTAWSDHGIVYTAPAAGNAYYPCALYDLHEFGSGGLKYCMWYSDGDGAVFRVKSTDGMSWSAPTTMNGLGGKAHHVQVLYDANRFGLGATGPKYRMWYWDFGAPTIYSISSIATAESVDGINWINKTTVTQNPAAKLIQDPDLGVGWNRGTYGPVYLFYQPVAANSGADPWSYSYIMYYDGTSGSTEETGLAYSADGVLWKAYSAVPVLAKSAIPAWDSNDSVYGTVYRDPLGFHYWYSGGVANPSEGIGYAVSADGKTWVKNPGHIFHVSDGVAYRNERVYTPSVIDDGTGVLKMYYTAKAIGGPKKIGWATLILDTTPPTVSSTLPANAATGVAVNSGMTATFSEALDPLTVTTATFTLKQGATPVSGAVTYAGVTATFTPSVNLAFGTVYTATITTGVKDLAGNALANPYVWSFTTAPPPTTAASSVTAGATPIFSATMLGQTSMRATNAVGALTNPMIASSKDGNLTIELARGTKILRNGVRVLSIDANQVDSPPASDGLEVIVAYEFSPAGTVFNPAPRVTIKYDADKLPENVLGVALARYNDSSKSWEELPAQGVAGIGGPVNGAVDHFSKIGVVAKLAPLPEKTVNTNLKPRFIIDKLMLSPAVLNAGEFARVQVSVANDGNIEGTYPLILKMDGKQLASREVTLAPGQETAVSFAIRDAAPGKHLIEVAEQKGSFKVDDGFNGIRDLWAQLLQSLRFE